MNLNEAKTILLLYRPGTADADDPQIAEALGLAKREPELARWLEYHGARQPAVRTQFRQIPVPAGLKEQIISEQAARVRRILWQSRLAVAAGVAILLLVSLTIYWLPPRPGGEDLVLYRNQMARIALRGYGMDLTTNDPAQIRAYLAQNQAPADYVLPAALQNVAVAGCAVESWQNAKVSMICFRTGKPLAPGTASDLWLFIVDRVAVKQVAAGVAPKLSRVKRLITATWIEGDKLYVLGTAGTEQTIRPYL